MSTRIQKLAVASSSGAVLRGREQLKRALDQLAQAQNADNSASKFLNAHLAALHAASAVAAISEVPARMRTKSVWLQLPRASAELAPWAEVFAASARLRPLADMERTDRISWDRADELLELADTFVSDVVRNYPQLLAMGQVASGFVPRALAG